MQIRIPKEDSYYSTYLSCCGPFHDSGEPFETITVDDGNDYLHQGDRLYGETSVSHSKSDANITINSLIGSSDMKPHSNPVWTQYDHLVTLQYDGDTAISLGTFPALLAGASHYDVRDTGIYLEGIKHGVGKDHMYYASCAFSKQWDRFPNDLHITCQMILIEPIRRLDGTFDPSYIRRRVDYLETKIVRVNDEGQITTAMAGYSPDGLKTTYVGSWAQVPKFFARQPYKANVGKALTWYRKFSNNNYFETLSLPDTDEFGDLTQAACENVNPNTINAIAFVKDLKDVKSLVPKLKGLSQIRTHAGNYLGVEYGVLPTISDLQTIWESFRTKYFYDKHGFQRASAYDTESQFETSVVETVEVKTTTALTKRVHLAINTSDTGLDALTERLRKIGVFPSLTNLWDLVPYSFVLDWFVDVGSVLERIDTRHQLLNLDIKYCIVSSKMERTSSFVSKKEGLYVEMISSSYRRVVGSDIPQPKIFKENRITAQDHWVEGAALILARKK